MRAAPPQPGQVSLPAAPRPPTPRICAAFFGPSFLHLHLFRPLPKVISTLSTGFFETERGVTGRWVESPTT